MATAKIIAMTPQAIGMLRINGCQATFNSSNTRYSMAKALGAPRSKSRESRHQRVIHPASTGCGFREVATGVIH